MVWKKKAAPPHFREFENVVKTPTTEEFDVDAYLKRAAGVDLLGVDTKGLSLKERLRQRKQIKEQQSSQNITVPHTYQNLVSVGSNCQDTQQLEISLDTKVPSNTSDQPRVTASLIKNHLSERQKVSSIQRKEILEREFRYFQDELTNSFSEVFEECEELLSEKELVAVKLSQEGSSLQEMSRILNVNRGAVRNRLSLARAKIEPQLLTQRNLFRLSELPRWVNSIDITTETLLTAKGHKSLPTFLFLNLSYSTPEIVSWFIENKTNIIPEQVKPFNLLPLHSVF